MLRLLQRPGLGVLAGALVMAPVLVVLAVQGFDEQSSQERPRAADLYLTAVERQARATYYAEYRFERTTSTGQSFTSATTEAQAPPRRSIVGNGTAEVVLDEMEYLCTTAEPPSCRRSGSRLDYEARVIAAVNTVRLSVSGTGRPHDVAMDGRCFVITLRPGFVENAYGARTRTCFDQATGAVSSNEVTRAGGTDRYTATLLRSMPSPEAFELPASPRS